jgi:predicted transcriptional regulator YdeE
MDDLVKFEIIKFPKTFIVGKKFRYSYDALDSGDNRLPAFWDICYKDNIFAPLELQTKYIFNSSHTGVFFDWHLGDRDFSYIIGLLMKDKVAVPEGYSIYELNETDVALCWIKCKSLNKNRAVPFESTAKAIEENGRSCNNMKWCIDLYDHSRSTIPDENGYVILDCYVPLD